MGCAESRCQPPSEKKLSSSLVGTYPDFFHASPCGVPEAGAVKPTSCNVCSIEASSEKSSEANMASSFLCLPDVLIGHLAPQNVRSFLSDGSCHHLCGSLQPGSSPVARHGQQTGPRACLRRGVFLHGGPPSHLASGSRGAPGNCSHGLCFSRSRLAGTSRCRASWSSSCRRSWCWAAWRSLSAWARRPDSSLAGSDSLCSRLCSRSCSQSCWRSC